MPDNLDRLLEALKTEFTGDITFHASVPSTISPPAVIVMPADPFIENATHGGVRETWDILVAVSLKEPGRGITVARNISLRVRASSALMGAHWHQASGFRVGDQAANSQMAVTVNTVSFIYEP